MRRSSAAGDVSVTNDWRERLRLAVPAAGRVAMKSSRGPLWARAVHFAGHVVMVDAVGLRLHGVTLRADSDYARVSYQTATGHLALLPSDDSMFRYLAEQDVLVHVAGAAAESIYQVFDANAAHHAVDDARSRQLLSLVEPSQGVVDEWLRYLERRASAILSEEHNWTRVRKLAGALLEREKWTADDLYELYTLPLTEDRRWSPPAPKATPGVPLDMLIDLREVADFPLRAIGSLETSGIRTVWHIAHRTERDLLSLRNIGRKTIQQINAALAPNGWAIGMYAREEHAE